MLAVNLKKTLFLAVDKSLQASDTILVPIRKKVYAKCIFHQLLLQPYLK